MAPGVGSASRRTSSQPAPPTKKSARCQPGSGSGIPAPMAAATSSCVPAPLATGPTALTAPASSPSTVRRRVSVTAPTCCPAYDPTSSPPAPASAGTPSRLTAVLRLPGRSLIPASMAPRAATTPTDVRPLSTATSSSGPAARAPRTTALQGTGPRCARRAWASQGGTAALRRDTGLLSGEGGGAFGRRRPGGVLPTVDRVAGGNGTDVFPEGDAPRGCRVLYERNCRWAGVEMERVRGRSRPPDPCDATHVTRRHA